ncbi:MAG: RidA family protein [Crocinitomicaceae bacterium]|nr:RidA family protein [Crocinitomicaceae bacterium]
MTRKLISSGSDFEKKAAYSRAVVVDKFIFVSGTTGFDYSTMEISENVAEQTAQCFENIKKALGEAGATLNDIVKVNYILPNKNDFESCWPILRDYLGDIRPAATMWQAELLDPRMKIEIEVQAILS